jgi:RNA-binding protein
MAAPQERTDATEELVRRTRRAFANKFTPLRLERPVGLLDTPQRWLFVRFRLLTLFCVCRIRSTIHLDSLDLFVPRGRRDKIGARFAMTPAERKRLRARAHKLHPIMQLGARGLTDAVVAEVDRALAHHELIKVRAAPLNRDEREVALASICERTGAQAVQHIGKMLIVYRAKPEVSGAPADAPGRSRSPARATPTGRRPSGRPARRSR